MKRGTRVTFHGQIGYVLYEGEIKSFRNPHASMKRVMKIEKAIVICNYHNSSANL